MGSFADLFSIADRRCLVTGGTSGLGEGIAHAFLEQGADVIVCGGHPEKAAELEKFAEERGRRFMALRCDITDSEDVRKMFSKIDGRFGRLDILVNSAGINMLEPAETYREEDFDKVMATNVKGLHLVTQEAGRRFMIPQGYGRILNISSVKGFIGTDKNYAAYCASKGAVNMYTRQIACEWGKYHITCNAIAPTFVRTPINAFQLDDEDFYNSLIERIPLGRIGTKEDIAAAAVFLCSDAASFISGQVIAVDGGLTARQ